MKAAVYSETGPQSVLRYEELSDPALGPGTVLVRNEAIARGSSTVLDVGMLRPQNLTLVGCFMGMEMPLSPRCHALVEGLLERVATGELHAVIDRSFPLAEAADAHAYIESRAALGRVLLRP